MIRRGDWVHALASAPDIDNQPLTILLAWVARETGVAVRYATPAIERRASTHDSARIDSQSRAAAKRWRHAGDD